MNPVDRRMTIKTSHWRNVATLGLLLALPAAAQAQSFSPGDLIVTAPPSLNGSSINSILGPAPLDGGAGANAPDFQYTAYGDLSERYTTNAQGASGGTDDFDSRAGIGFAATETTDRINASLVYDGALDYFAQTGGNVILTNNLSGHGVVSVMPDHLTISADAYIAPIYSTGLGNVAPAGAVLPPGSNGDLTNTYSFDVNPDIFFGLGEFLRSDTLPSYIQTYIDQPVGANASLLPNVSGDIETKALTQRITSGDFFNRLQWSAIGNYTETDRSGLDMFQRSATGELSYAVVHDISIAGDAGYQTVKANVPLNSALSGPIFMGGFNFDTPYLTGQIRAGEQYRSFSVTGHLAYQITPLLTMTAAATDDVTTPGASALNPSQLLAGVIAGIASGQIQIPASGILALDQSTLAGVNLQDTLARIKTQTVAIQYGGVDRLTAVLSAYASTQDNLSGVLINQNANLQSFGITPSFNYALSEALNVGVDLSYTEQSLTTGHDNLEQFDAHADYTLTELTRLYGSFIYQHRDSDAALASFSAGSGDFSSFSIQIGIRRQF